jgi:hypothetical protein
MRAIPGSAKEHAGGVRSQGGPGKMPAASRKMRAAAWRSLWLDKHLAVSVKGKPVA